MRKSINSRRGVARHTPQHSGGGVHSASHEPTAAFAGWAVTPSEEGRTQAWEWATGQWGACSATEAELRGAERFWRESLGLDPFGFLPGSGWEHSDFLFAAMHPRLAEDPEERAAFWVDRCLEELSLDTEFLTAFLNEAVNLWHSGESRPRTRR